ncbi:MAG: hypothetical protein JW913_10350 [Chitinispirillaceae bacterium]|nr:hypothetical protein [Chitinispirillaceae bacterium]
MNLAKVKIGDLVRIPEVQTVIRLEADDSSIRKAAATFVVTADVGTHLHLLVESMKRLCGQGFFLQGDFGSGKSHFLSALFAFFSRAPGYEQLCQRHEELQRLKEQGRLILPVAISLVHFRGSTPLETIVLEAIEAALQKGGRRVALTRRGAVLLALRQSLDDNAVVREITARVGVAPDGLAAWIDAHPAEAATTAEPLLRQRGKTVPTVPMRERKELFEAAFVEVRSAGYDGCLLLVDELSEFFRSKPDAPQLNDDARTLQLLGEMGGDHPLWIIAAVQESVERTGDIAQATFRKIKDRFPVKLHLSTLHIRDLIGKRLIEVTDEGERTIFHVYEEYRGHFPRLTTTPALFRSVYPVHPVTLDLLEGLGDLFSQHRGIVDFIHAQIAGDPSRAIRGILDRPCTELLAPDAIYDHFAPRIAEFSSFYIYPSRIVPHLDNCIETALGDPSDRMLAKRLVRIIALHAIHPTAKPPSARMLAELVACMLSFESPDANAQYVAEVLLDPVVAASRFLIKKTSPSGSALDSAYEITTSDDKGKVLSARIDRVAGEIMPDDSRLFINPLAELPESYAWPGPSLWQEISRRSITWRQSLRTAAVAVVTPGQEEQLSARLEALYAAGNADFGMVIAIGKCLLRCRHTAVWRVGLPEGDDTLFKEYFACKTVLGELRPGNPADIPLIPLVKERLRKSEAAVGSALLRRVYQGSFDDASLVVDPAVRQVMRFERLLEIASEQLCEERYPRFKEIAPRGLPPSLRLYQRLFEEFVTAGTLPLRDARARSLTESIETLAAPLGLVEVKNGNYLMAPQPSTNAFLSYLFGHLSASEPRLRAEIMQELQNGPYGVPHDMACFLLASLAQCGLISLINHGRALPLDYIKLMTVDQVETIAPGELINQADRETIVNCCPFLLPSGQGDAFDLRRQREAWAAAVKFKSTATALLASLAPQLQAVSGYAAFSRFDFEGVRDAGERLQKVVDEIKTSYAARDGLERFAAAWRSSGLSVDDVSTIRQTARFLSRQAEKIVYVNHYCNHPSVVAAAQADKAVGAARDAVLDILDNPSSLLIPDEGERLQAAFEQFKAAYSDCYSAAHARFHAPAAATPLSRQGERNLLLLRRLAGLPALDRPPGTQQFLASYDTPAPRPCGRNLIEELLRSAICGCNYTFGEEPYRTLPGNPSSVIDRLLTGYLAILGSADVLEAIAAHTFAIRDIDPGTSKRLAGMHALLKGKETISIAALADLLDEATIAAIGRALSGYARIEQRSFEALRGNLAGRRLNAARIRKIVEEWIGQREGEVILSIDDAQESAAPKTIDPLLWPQLHPELFGTPLHDRALESGELAQLAEALERRFPAADLGKQLAAAPAEALLRFLCDEPAHRTALAAAWGLLARRVCANRFRVPEEAGSIHFLDKTETPAIERRIATLRAIGTLAAVHFPGRLLQRSHIVAAFNDPWADAAVKKEALAALARLHDAGADWLSSLPAVEPVECEHPATIVIIDAIPPDIWLTVDSTGPGLFAAAKRTWHRQTSPSTTVGGLNELFGFPQERDPINEMAQRSVPYLTIEGNEAYGWTDQLPQATLSCARIVRIAFFDRQVHDGLADLPAMAEKLSLLLQRNLPQLINQCREKGHRLILTTDHGLSFSEKGLHHGGGGLFEQAIFRAVWE